MDNDIIVHFKKCDEDEGTNYLPQYVGFFDQSGVKLSNNTSADWGFAANPLGLNSGSQIDGDLTNGIYWESLDTELTFGPFSSHGGYYLADYVWVLWDGPGMGKFLPSAGRNEVLHARVCHYYADGPTDVTVHVEGYLTQDDTDFTDASDHCPIDPIWVFGEDWEFGSFVACEGIPVSIFFPYIPKLTDSAYWSGVALVNQGIRDFDPSNGGALEGDIYEADGNHYTVAFPALPVRNMQTWLFTEGENGTGFYGASGDPLTEGMFLQPVTTGDDLVFGDVRMSMFVTGLYPAMYQDDLAGGDLDGYMLIGDKVSGSVDGAYLPRNFAVAGQAQDMPIQVRKQ